MRAYNIRIHWLILLKIINDDLLSQRVVASARDKSHWMNLLVPKYYHLFLPIYMYVFYLVIAGFNIHNNSNILNDFIIFESFNQFLRSISVMTATKRWNQQLWVKMIWITDPKMLQNRVCVLFLSLCQIYNIRQRIDDYYLGGKSMTAS